MQDFLREIWCNLAFLADQQGLWILDVDGPGIHLAWVHRNAGTLADDLVGVIRAVNQRALMTAPLFKDYS